MTQMETAPKQETAVDKLKKTLDPGTEKWNQAWDANKELQGDFQKELGKVQSQISGAQAEAASEKQNIQGQLNGLKGDPVVAKAVEYARSLLANEELMGQIKSNDKAMKQLYRVRKSGNHTSKIEPELDKALQTNDVRKVRKWINAIRTAAKKAGVQTWAEIGVPAGQGANPASGNGMVDSLIRQRPQLKAEQEQTIQTLQKQLAEVDTTLEARTSGLQAKVDAAVKLQKSSLENYTRANEGELRRSFEASGQKWSKAQAEGKTEDMAAAETDLKKGIGACIEANKEAYTDMHKAIKTLNPEYNAKPETLDINSPFKDAGSAPAVKPQEKIEATMPPKPKGGMLTV